MVSTRFKMCYKLDIFPNIRIKGIKLWNHRLDHHVQSNNAKTKRTITRQPRFSDLYLFIALAGLTTSKPIEEFNAPQTNTNINCVLKCIAKNTIYNLHIYIYNKNIKTFFHYPIPFDMIFYKHQTSWNLRYPNATFPRRNKALLRDY